TRADLPSAVRPRHTDPVPLMRATPQPAGVHAASTSSDSLTTAKRGARACSFTHCETWASSADESTPARPRHAAAIPAERQRPLPDAVAAAGSVPFTWASAPSIAVAMARNPFSRPTLWRLLLGPSPRARTVPPASAIRAWVLLPPPSTARRNWASLMRPRGGEGESCRRYCRRSRAGARAAKKRLRARRPAAGAKDGLIPALEAQLDSQLHEPRIAGRRELPEVAGSGGA